MLLLIIMKGVTDQKRMVDFSKLINSRNADTVNCITLLYDYFLADCMMCLEDV